GSQGDLRNQRIFAGCESLTVAASVQTEIEIPIGDAGRDRVRNLRVRAVGDFLRVGNAVAVRIVFACVSRAVPVGVRLVRIGGQGAIVEDVGNAVPVGIVAPE